MSPKSCDYLTIEFFSISDLRQKKLLTAFPKSYATKVPIPLANSCFPFALYPENLTSDP